MLDETIIQWGRGKLGEEIVFPSTDLRNILFSVGLESSKKKEKKLKLFVVLSTLSLGIVGGISCLIFGGPYIANLDGLAVVGGLSGGVYYAYQLSWEIQKINEDELNKITKRCILYNRRKEYHWRKNNCQQFINDILKDIDTPFNPKGDLKKLLIKYLKMVILNFLIREIFLNQEENSIII